MFTMRGTANRNGARIMEWKPIEIAPKDERILLWDGTVEFGIWDGINFRSYEHGSKIHPTHWMSLPKPPK